MLYLEDFLELIETFPSELRDGLGQLRSMDAKVQTELSKQQERIDRLFANAPNMSEQQRKIEVDAIKQEYKAIMKNADDKATLATKMHDVCQRYYAKLAQEIANFRYELEADSAGITATLEQRVRDAEQQMRQMRRERKRKMREREARNALAAAQAGNTAQGSSTGAQVKAEPPTVGGEATLPKRCATVPQKMADLTESKFQGAGLHHVSSAASLKSMGTDLGSPTTAGEISVLTGHDVSAGSVGPPSHASASANLGGQSTSAGTMVSPSQFVPGIAVSGESRHGRPRKLTTKVQEMLQANMARSHHPSGASHHHQQQQHPSASTAGRRHSHAPAGRLPSSALGARLAWSRGASVASGASEDHLANRNAASEMGDDSVLESDNEPVNSDEEEESERRWCICIQPSFGNMVACDNDKCPFEWFHYECVNITQPPKGKWYCPHCSDSMKRKKTGEL